LHKGQPLSPQATHGAIGQPAMPQVAPDDTQRERHDIQLLGAQQIGDKGTDCDVQSPESIERSLPPLPSNDRDAVISVAANSQAGSSETTDLCPQFAFPVEESSGYPHHQMVEPNILSGSHVVRPGATRYRGAFHLKLDDEALEAVRRQLTTGALPAEGAGLSPRPPAPILTSTGGRVSDTVATPKPSCERRQEQEWDGSVADEDASHSGSGGSSEGCGEAVGILETPREGTIARECSSVSAEGRAWRGPGQRGPPSQAGSQRSRLEPTALLGQLPSTPAFSSSKPSKPSRGLLCAAEVVGTSAERGPQIPEGSAYRPAVNSRLRCPNLCLWRRGNAPRTAGSVGGPSGGSDAVRVVAASFNSETKPLDLQPHHCRDTPFSQVPVPDSLWAADNNGHDQSAGISPAAPAHAANDAKAAATSTSNSTVWDTPSKNYLADVRHWLEEVEELQHQMSAAASGNLKSGNAPIPPLTAVVTGQIDSDIGHGL